MKKIIAIITAACMFAVPVFAAGECQSGCRTNYCGKVTAFFNTIQNEKLPETLQEVYEMLLEKYGIKINYDNTDIDFSKDAAQAGNGWMNVPKEEEREEINKPEPEIQTPEPEEAPKEEEKPEENQQVENNSSYEMQVLNLVNEQRRKNGLSALTYSYELEAVGKAHSEDMLKNHYFAHNSLDGKTPFDRMRNAGIKFGYAAENIAAGQQGPAEVVNAWMNSEGHRKNILNPNYKKMGVGIAYGGSYGIYWTQEFTD